MAGVPKYLDPEILDGLADRVRVGEAPEAMREFIEKIEIDTLIGFSLPDVDGWGGEVCWYPRTIIGAAPKPLGEVALRKFAASGALVGSPTVNDCMQPSGYGYRIRDGATEEQVERLVEGRDWLRRCGVQWATIDDIAPEQVAEEIGLNCLALLGWAYAYLAAAPAWPCPVPCSVCGRSVTAGEFEERTRLPEGYAGPILRTLRSFGMVRRDRFAKCASGKPRHHVYRAAPAAEWWEPTAIAA